jgi:hypothetical protein
VRSNIFTIAVSSTIRASAAWLTAARSALAAVSIAISEAMLLFSASIAARSSAKARISAWASVRVVGSSATGVVIAAIPAESPSISQTFQPP